MYSSVGQTSAESNEEASKKDGDRERGKERVENGGEVAITATHRRGGDKAVSTCDNKKSAREGRERERGGERAEGSDTSLQRLVAAATVETRRERAAEEETRNTTTIALAPHLV
jgi:hypothetical protein